VSTVQFEKLAHNLIHFSLFYEAISTMTEISAPLNKTDHGE